MNIIQKSCATGNFTAGRHGMKPEAIVIHIADGTLVGTDAWFNDPKSKLSAHYIVSKAGEIHQYVRDEDEAYHAGAPLKATWRLLKPHVNANWYTIGIEHEGHASEPWPDVQYTASAELCKALAARWGIPIDVDHIVLHREIHGDRPCPGYIFDREKYLTLCHAKTEAVS